MDTPQTFRKKPVVILAFEFTKTNGNEVVNWIRECGNACSWSCFAIDDQLIDIVTLEGVMRADLGDYIIRGVEGECYPCKPRIFHKTYEQVVDNGTGGGE